MPVFQGKVQYGCLVILVTLLAMLFSGCAARAPVTSPVQEVTPSPAPPATAYAASSPGISPITSSPAPIVNNTSAPTGTPDTGFETKGSLNKMYYYTIDGIPGYIPFKVYTGVNDYIVSLGEIYTGDDYNAVIGNEVQQKYISPMVENIRRAAKNPDDEARIAISLVQHIKYDANAVNEIQVNMSKTGQKYIGRYPYTILDQNWGGICGEKSFLLALLLKELGYGWPFTSLMTFTTWQSGSRHRRSMCTRGPGMPLSKVPHRRFRRSMSIPLSERMPRSHRPVRQGSWLSLTGDRLPRSEQSILMLSWSDRSTRSWVK